MRGAGLSLRLYTQHPSGTIPTIIDVPRRMWLYGMIRVELRAYRQYQLVETSKDERYISIREFFDGPPPTHPNNTTSSTANLHKRRTIAALASLSQEIDRSHATTHHLNTNNDGSPQVRHQIRRHRLRHQPHQQRCSLSSRRQDISSSFSA